MIRNFTWNDLASLRGLINRVHAADGDERTIDDLFLREWLTQPGYTPLNDCWLVEEDDEVRGYAILYPELPIGRTVLELGVAPSYRGSQIEGGMVRQGLARAQELGARVLHICTPQKSFLAGVLEKEGLSLTRCYWMMHWEGKGVPSPQPPPGFAITTFREGDAERLTQVQNDAFEGSWGFCINTVEQIEYRTRLSINHLERIFFLNQNDKSAGYCWTHLIGDPKSPVGIIGMIGVTPAYRGQSLSRPILLAGMEYLYSAGVKYIKLDVDGENAAAIGLYRSVGFEKVAEDHWFEARVSTG